MRCYHILSLLQLVHAALGPFLVQLVIMLAFVGAVARTLFATDVRLSRCMYVDCDTGCDMDDDNRHVLQTTLALT